MESKLRACLKALRLLLDRPSLLWEFFYPVKLLLVTMKFIFRTFFKTLRLLLGPPLLLWEFVSRPSELQRPPALQAEVNRQCEKLALFHYKTCPFCMKVRQEMRRLALPIERLDAQPPGALREQLGRLGGQLKVPCLRITDKAGNSEFLYDSGKIISYLQQRFSPA